MPPWPMPPWPMPPCPPPPCPPPPCPPPPPPPLADAAMVEPAATAATAANAITILRTMIRTPFAARASALGQSSLRISCRVAGHCRASEHHDDKKRQLRSR